MKANRPLLELTTISSPPKIATLHVQNPKKSTAETGRTNSRHRMCYRLSFSFLDLHVVRLISNQPLNPHMRARQWELDGSMIIYAPIT
jgi:hypothetical protein